MASAAGFQLMIFRAQSSPIMASPVLLSRECAIPLTARVSRTRWSDTTEVCSLEAQKSNNVALLTGYLMYNSAGHRGPWGEDVSQNTPGGHSALHLAGGRRARPDIRGLET